MQKVEYKTFGEREIDSEFFRAIADQCRSNNLGLCGLCTLVNYCEDEAKKNFSGSWGGAEYETYRI